MSDLPRLAVPRLNALFADGRAPQCWRRQLSHLTRRQATLPRACAWVDEIVQQPVPKLQSGPLLGSCLAEVVELPPATEEETEVQQARRASFAPHSAETGKRAAKGYPFRPMHRPASAMSPALPETTAASSDLLRRWAGRTAVSHTTPALKPKRTHLPAKGSQPARPPGAVQSPQQWADHVVQRVREQLALPEKHPSRLTQGGISPQFRAKPPQAVSSPADLEAQWQQPLWGKTAPAALLAELQTRAAQVAAADDPAAAQRKAAKPPGTPSERRDSQPETTFPNSQFSLGQTGTAFTPPAPSPQGDEELAERPSLTRPGAAPEPSPRFAPPQLAEVLPELRPLPRPGTTNAFPIAANAAKSSARREASDRHETAGILKASSAKETTPEDLDTLARQIKQILDEESRRHGIDV